MCGCGWTYISMTYFSGKDPRKESGKIAVFRESGEMLWGVWGVVDYSR